MRKGRLDRQLAEGADPADTDELALRARQLTSQSYRRTLADSFDEVMAIADGLGPRISAAPPLQSREVRAARSALLDLSRTLREDAPVAPSGVAQAQRLLTDGMGPLYVESYNDALWQAVRQARAALEGHD